MLLLIVGPTFDKAKSKINKIVNIGDSEIWLFDDVSKVYVLLHDVKILEGNFCNFVNSTLKSLLVLFKRLNLCKKYS